MKSFTVELCKEPPQNGGTFAILPPLLSLVYDGLIRYFISGIHIVFRTTMGQSMTAVQNLPFQDPQGRNSLDLGGAVKTQGHASCIVCRPMTSVAATLIREAVIDVAN